MSIEIDLSTTIARSDEQLSADLEGEAVLMSIAKGSYYALNATGSRIWELLETPRSVADLCAALQKEFAVDASECQQQVLAHLNELLDQGLVKVA